MVPRPGPAECAVRPAGIDQEVSCLVLSEEIDAFFKDAKHLAGLVRSASDEKNKPTFAGNEDAAPRASLTSLRDQVANDSFANGESGENGPIAEEPMEVPSSEYVKSFLAALVVVAVFVFVAVVVPVFGADFQEPTCEVTAERSCEACGRGTQFLPLYGEWEKSWPRWLQIGLYFIGLMWFFVGVGVVCDQFMAAIEAITASERTVWVEVHSGARRKFRISIWNATIANLSLMALGSSAPEILLSATELVGNNYYAGRLGPSTIVGSAAFNLLVITAVCISAIPAPEVRTIEGTDVFIVTTTISVFAYLWMAVILQLITPDKVELWEGIATLLMFPALLIISYAADRGWLARVFRGNDTKRQLQLESRGRQIQARYGKTLPAAALKMILETELTSEKHSVSRAQLRKNITASFTGRGFERSLLPVADAMEARKSKTGALIIGFKEERHVVLECAGTLPLKVVSSREPGMQVELYYYTFEGSAKKDLRFKHVEGTLVFGPRQREAIIHVPIIDNDSWDPDEEFYVCLEDEAQAKWPSRASSMSSQTLGRQSWRLGGAAHATNSRSSAGTPDYRLGVSRATVTVLNDDMPGVLSFDADEVQTEEGNVATIGVVRMQGSSGRIECTFSMEDDSAVGGKDFVANSGKLVFEDGELHKDITIQINDSGNADRENDIVFRLNLRDPSPGVKFDANQDGGEDAAVCNIIVLPRRRPSWSTRLYRRIFDLESYRVVAEEWREQFVGAVFCNGSAEDQMEASLLDWFFHIMTLVWKVLFAFIPPPTLWSGWGCFFAALIMIGAVTALVGEIASLLGCAVGMADEVTAITLVALGTSLPDTFASKAAAQQDDNADNSIGNVMGSNSVNVFLGLGISWTIGAAFWASEGPTQQWLSYSYEGKTFKEKYVDSGEYPDGGFMVPAETLLFSVIVYTAVALCCITLLICRRFKYGGELGGPKFAQLRDSIFLVVLWAGYVSASTVYASMHG